MDKLTISCRPDRDALVAELAGVLELTTAGHFEQTLTSSLAGSGVTQVVLDCTRLEFIDSSGLGAMVTLLRMLRESGGRVDLAGVRAGLLELLYITKLEKHFGMYRSVDDALMGSVEPITAPAAAASKPGPRPEPFPATSVPTPAEGTPELPPYAGMANYPTWYVTQWFLNQEELHQLATGIIKQSEFANDASRALHRLLLKRCEEALKASTMVAGLFGFVLGHVEWPEVIAEIRKNPAKSYNKG